MRSLQAHRTQTGMLGRRLGLPSVSTYGNSYAVYSQGLKWERSRVRAAEVIGSDTERLHDVRRRSLKQSFELEGTAPDGHPDNSLVEDLPVISAVARAGSRTRLRNKSTPSVGHSDGTSAVHKGAIRRLGNSRQPSTSNATEATPLAATATFVAVQQQSITDHQQSQLINKVLQQQQQQQEEEVSQSEPGSNDPEADRELQAEFHESQCCQDVLDIVADELKRFSPHHTVTAINRLAKLGRSLPWQERSTVLKDTNFILLLDRLVRQAPMLNSFQLATSLYSCAVLQIPLFSLKTGTFSTLLPALEAAICAQVRQFNDRDVSSTLYAYAQLKPHTAVDTVRKQQSYSTALQLARQAQRLMSRKEMSGQSMSMVLWALATLHSNNNGSNEIAASSRAVVAAATQSLLQQETSFDQLGSQVVANSIWAAEKLGQADVQLLQKGCDWMAHNPQKCKVQEVLNVLWAAGAARFRPKLLGTLTRHIAGQVKALKPADVASLFHVLGIFGFDFDISAHKPLLQTLLPRAAELLPQMKPSEVTSLYWGLGMTKQVDNELFLQITTVVAKLQQQAVAGQQQQQQRSGQQRQQRDAQQRVVQMPASLQRQAFQAFIAAKLEDAAVDLPGDVLAAFRDAWMEGSGSGGSSSGGKRKRQQLRPLLEELQWMLQAFMVKARVNCRSRLDGLVTVDVELNASGQRLVAIQILDEHDVDSQGHRLAPVLWEEDLLHRNGYDQVYWVQVSDYKRCPKEKRPRFLADILQRVGVNTKERLVSAAESSWLSAGCKVPANSGGAAGGMLAGWDAVGAGGVSAKEADILLQDGRGAGGGGGGYASGGGRGSRRNMNARRR